VFYVADGCDGGTAVHSAMTVPEASHV